MRCLKACGEIFEVNEGKWSFIERLMAKVEMQLHEKTKKKVNRGIKI